MQNLGKITDYKIQRLSELLAIENGEIYFNAVVETFKSPNKDVEHFLKTKAVQATKLNTATTYLVYIERSALEIDLVGYFSLAIKMLTVVVKIFTKNNKQIWLL